LEEVFQEWAIGKGHELRAGRYRDLEFLANHWRNKGVLLHPQENFKDSGKKNGTRHRKEARGEGAITCVQEEGVGGNSTAIEESWGSKLFKGVRTEEKRPDRRRDTRVGGGKEKAAAKEVRNNACRHRVFF